MRLGKCLWVLLFCIYAMKGLAQEQAFSVTVTGTGRDVILLPGLMSDSRTWEQIAPTLATGYRLHLVELAGFSGKAAIAGDLLPAVKAQLLAYVRDTGLQQPVVIGHSLGGFLALWCALAEPALFGPLISIDGLPYYAPTLTFDSATTAASMIPQAEQLKGYYAAAGEAQLQQMTRQALPLQSMSEPNREKILAMAAGSDGAAVGGAVATLLTTDLRAELGHLTQPLLLLGALGPARAAGLEERAMALYQQQLEQHPQAELRFNPEAGHFIQLDDPQWLLAQITAFLERY